MPDYRAGGLSVELDDSNCIVIRQPRTTVPDVLVTVTDAADLILGIQTVLTYRDVREGRIPDVPYEPITDSDAIDRISRLLSARRWPGASGLEDIKAIVEQTGRVITDDPDAEWPKH